MENINKSLCIFNFSAFFKSQILLLPVLYLFYLSNGLDWSDYFLFQGIVVLINVLLQFPIGIIGNYVQRKYLILISYILFLGRVFLWIFFHGYLIVLTGEILAAISKAMFDAVESPYIYDVLKENKKEEMMKNAYGKLNFYMCLGTAIASILGTFLYGKFGLKILLGTEFIIISTAVILGLRLSITNATSNYKFSFLKVIAATKYILNSPKYVWQIMLSGLLVAFSHFFFWSFQPLMKLAIAPLYLFGAVIFINNIIRAIASFFTDNVSKYVSFDTLGIQAFILGLSGILLFLGIYKNDILNSKTCFLLILFLCLYIAFQLMFTISSASYLQKAVPNRIRGYIASSSMFVARLNTAIVLIMPKYLSNTFSLPTIYNIYFYIFLILGLLFLIKFLKYMNKQSSLVMYIFVIIAVFMGIQNNNIHITDADIVCAKKRLNLINKEIIKIQYYDGVGDYWLADDLLIALKKEGYEVIKIPYSDSLILRTSCKCADYSINLMGHITDNEKIIDKTTKNIMWLIYPKPFDDETFISELVKTVEQYDVAIISSKKLYNLLMKKTNKPLFYLPQFTNIKKFYYDFDKDKQSELLFVGTYYFERMGPNFALKNNLPITIYGGRWPKGIAKKEYIDNRILRKYYSSSKIVLNDTFGIMKDWNFVSNRIFDATACGSFVISDYIPDIEEIYGDNVPMWRSEEELVSLVNYYLSHSDEREAKAKKAQQITLSNFTSERIAKEIIKIIEKIKK